MEPVVVNTPQPVPQVVTINTHVVKKRIFAALIDSIIWAIILMILSSMFGETSVGMNGEDGPGASFNLSGFPALVYGAAAFAYYVGLEWKKGGTLGKKIMKIHVANMQGGPITAKQAVIRNLLRIADAFPYVVPYVVGLISIATNENKQRIGDKVAGTLVVLN